MTDRRTFIKTGTLAGMGLFVSGRVSGNASGTVSKGLRIGIIGLDTSHSTAFTKLFNDDQTSGYGGFKVVAAYPYGSRTIKSSIDRIPSYTEEVKKMGVEIVDSIKDLLKKVDFVLLETNDGHPHLEQALEVFKAGKPVFIDKPVAASLADAISIYRAAEKFKVPVFSASSLRYMSNMDDILKNQSIGKILGADTYSPCALEETHPDFFWYGIHGVEPLFTVMGPGCETVTRIHTPGADVATGVWNDRRIGTFRGLRAGKTGYGGYAFGEKGIKSLGDYNGYIPLVKEIVKFFQTGIAPVTAEETLEIFTFMEAADESKRRNGAPVMMQEVREIAMNKARDNF